MKNKIKAARICCFTLGMALLLSALFLVIRNVTEDRKSGEEAREILSELKGGIPAYTEPAPTIPAAETYDLYAAYEESPAVPEMETVEIGENAYLGYITIPELGIELPVLADWSYPNLKTAPCRYAGSLQENDLILCAHNYTTHFGRIGDLHMDDEIIFTDATGKAHHYSVINMEQLPDTAVGDMQFGDADDWDLTLFTCTLSGQSRVTVRAAKNE